MDVDDIVVGDVGAVWVYEPSIDRSEEGGGADSSVDCRAIGVDDGSWIGSRYYGIVLLYRLFR
jgi:hypothetical protein